MRPVVANLWQNLGVPSPGASVVVSTHLVSVGVQEQSVDDQLTLMSPGEITVELADPDDSIWAFIQTQLTSGSNLLPPYLQLIVDGSQVFLGTVDPSRIVRHLSATTRSIELGSQDWSSELANSYLDSWTRPIPPAVAYRSASGSMVGYSTYRINFQWSSWAANEVIFIGASLPISIGDVLTCDADPGVSYIVRNTQSPPPTPGVLTGMGCSGLPTGPYTQVTLDKSPWAIWAPPGVVNWGGNGTVGSIAPYSAYVPNYTNFIRHSSATTVGYYTVMAAVAASPATPVYTIYLNTVAGLCINDVLATLFGLSSATYTIIAINPELNSVTTAEAVTNLAVGNKLYFDDATGAEQVLVDAHIVLQTAAAPFAVDFSRFAPATMAFPVFGWISPAPYGSVATIPPPSDIEAYGATGVRVFSGLVSPLEVTGNPDTGWVIPGTATAPQADWTSQTLTPPATTMPSTVNTLSPYGIWRNHAYNSPAHPTWTSTDNGPIPTSNTDPTTWADAYSVGIANSYPTLVFYDYLTTPVRRLNFPAGVYAGSYNWSGTAFGALVPTSWPSASVLTSVCNFPGGIVGAVLGVTTLNTLELGFWGGGGVKSCAIPNYLWRGQLVATPYGPYLLGPQGYGQILYSGGVLSIVSVTIPAQVSFLWANTFVALSSLVAMVMGRLDTADATGAITATESWLFQLSLPPQPATTTVSATASILFSEKISDGAPTTLGAVRDPSKAGRVLGHFGGQLWQVDTKMSPAIERFTPAGMSALDCIQHACQVMNAMAVPLPTGVLQIVSRGLSEAVVPLTVLQVCNNQSRSWPHFYSIVRATTQDGKFYYDAVGASGGGLLEITGQPMLWNLSAAAAMATSYSAWFGTPRRTESQHWTYPDAATAPPWEGLAAFARVTVNGTGPWRVMSMTQNYIEGTADVVLVEAP